MSVSPAPKSHQLGVWVFDGMTHDAAGTKGGLGLPLLNHHTQAATKVLFVWTLKLEKYFFQKRYPV